MKTTINKSKKLLLVILMLAIVVPLQAQMSNTNDDSYITINGVVKNKQNKKKIEYANVSVKGTNIGTVTNEDGEFTLKIKSVLHAESVVVSHVGYASSQIALTGNDMDNVKIWLTPQNNLLNEVIVRAGEARQLVQSAINNIPSNYEARRCLLTGFYRETAQKRSRYINISEGVINIYKTAYGERSVKDDRVQVFKGRKLLSDRAGDTLAVRLLGGPTLSVYTDAVKNPDVLLDNESLSYYIFKMENPIYIGHRLQYVISFAPQVTLPYALFYGRLYIDRESLAFTRIELSLDMSDRNKATQAILRKKPYGVIFKPQELSFLIDYKERDGIMSLSYIRNETKFKCDWKKKLFSTGYTVVSEMVVTDQVDEGVKGIPYKVSFNTEDSFTDKVKAFTDDNFWGAYNIIAPTETLDKAVNKLKKQHKE